MAAGAPRVVVSTPEFFPLRPDIPASDVTDDDELAAVGRLIMHVPWRDPAKDLRLGEPSWYAAFNKAKATMPNVSKNLAKVRTIAEEGEHFKAHPFYDVFQVQWMPIVNDMDPELYVRARCDDRCWHCGRLPEGRLKTCARCKRAKYCSKECQSAAWWYHKRDASGVGCIHD